MDKDFIEIGSLTASEFKLYLDTARILKLEWRKGRNKPILKDQSLGMVFQKPSLRTRVSFDMAMLQLGGHALYLSPNEIGLGQRESIADVARVLARYVDGIMARVFAHDHVLQLAKYSSVPVINGLSDWEHPCQALADILTVAECFGKTRGLTVAFFGDGNNVARSLMFACALGRAKFVCASPKGFQLDAESVERARKMGGEVRLTEDAQEAAHDADVLYTDVWASMGQEEQASERARVFPPYQINSRLVNLANNDSIVMHCLPAHRGSEITDEVIDGPHSVVFDQAENRMHAQKAVLAILMGKKRHRNTVRSARRPSSRA